MPTATCDGSAGLPARLPKRYGGGAARTSATAMRCSAATPSHRRGSGRAAAEIAPVPASHVLSTVAMWALLAAKAAAAATAPRPGQPPPRLVRASGRRLVATATGEEVVLPGPIVRACAPLRGDARSRVLRLCLSRGVRPCADGHGSVPQQWSSRGLLTYQSWMRQPLSVTTRWTALASRVAVAPAVRRLAPQMWLIYAPRGKMLCG